MAVKPESPKEGFAVAIGSQTVSASELQGKRIRRHYIFHGRVQHCGFRMTSWKFAKEQHITGWVFNRTDGCVEMEAQGEPGRLWLFKSSIMGLQVLITEIEETELPVRTDEEWYLILRK